MPNISLNRSALIYWTALIVFTASLAGVKSASAGQGIANEFEVLLSATSADGRTFTQDPGYRMTDGYVDPYVLRAEEGDWLMLVSTTPSSNRLPQRIYMASSTDGMSWQVNTNALVNVPGGNALDPTAVALSNGSFRVYYTGTLTPNPFSDFYLTSGILSTNAQGIWSFAPDGIDLGISGVSAEAFAMSNGAVRIYICTTEGMKVYRASDGLTFAEEAASLPPGSDPSIIELPDHRLRMYYMQMTLSGSKEIFTALSSDGLNWNMEGTTGITSGQFGGVPDSFIDPAGNTRLFWVGSSTSPVALSLASPMPVFSVSAGGSMVGKIQAKETAAAVNFIGLSDKDWGNYDLIGSTVHCPSSNQIAVVVMDNATLVPYLVKADENNSCQEYAVLFGLTDLALWASYAVDAAGDVNGDGFVEYVVRHRDSGYTLLAYTAGSTNQLQGTGPVLGLDPAGLAGYRVEGAGDIDGDAYADLVVRDLASDILFMVHNTGQGGKGGNGSGYDSVLPLFGFQADTWSQFILESTGDFNADGFMDYIVQNTGKTVTYKIFGTGSNSYSSIESIP